MVARVSIKGAKSVRLPPQRASFVLGSRPPALRNPSLGSNAGIAIKPQAPNTTQYGKVPIGFGNTMQTGES